MDSKSRTPGAFVPPDSGLERSGATREAPGLADRDHRLAIGRSGSEASGGGCDARECAAHAAFLGFREHRAADQLGRVFELVGPSLRESARRILEDPWLADDVVQTVFVELFVIADRFAASRPLMPWLVRITECRARDLRRARSRDAHVPTEALDRHGDEVGDPIEATAGRESVQNLERAIQRLPIRCRAPLQLHYWRGWTAQRIAAAGRLPVGTVKSRLRRGVQLLRESLSG